MNDDNVLQLIQKYKPSQDFNELQSFFELAKTYNPQVIVEIGLERCGLLQLWDKVFSPELVIGIDDTQQVAEIAAGIEDLKAVVIAPAISQDETTYEHVKTILDGRQIDLLFIDGGHTYVEVKADFEMYSELVADGGIVVFHDIAVSNDNPSFCEVQRYWDEIKESYERTEFRRSVGIGVIFWNR